MVSLSMIAGGIGTILQGFNKGPVGSGYLCPHLCGPSYFSASIIAAKSGGLQLVLGMTAMAGLFEALISRVINRLRAIFPVEVTGFVVFMVGIVLIPVGTSKFTGINSLDSVTEAPEVVVGFLTLTVMVGLSVWGKGMLRLYCVLIAMIIGYLASYALCILTSSDISQVIHTPLISFPQIGHFGWSFNLGLLIPFLIASLASTLKTVGDLASCQKVNDTEWKRPEMKPISRGILADSIVTLSAGLIGGMAQSTSSSNVGVSIATGATSRRIAYAAGGIFISLAFLSKLSAVITIMPKPVMGATLIFVASFMIIAGIQIITSRLIDVRKTFVIGLSFIFGLSVDMVPGLYKNIHPWFQPLFSSSLSVATVSAIILNLIFRIGIAKHETLELEPGVDSSEKIFKFMESQGATWGARKEVIYRAISAMNEFFESVTSLGLAKGKIKADVSFDEFNLDIDIRYDGNLIEIPKELPTEAGLLDDDKNISKLSGFLMNYYADRVKSSI